MAKTKSAKEKDVEKAVADATNIETVEQELKEEYKEEIESAEQAMEAAKAEPELEKEVELVKEYTESSKKIEELADKAPDEIAKAVKDELEKVDALSRATEKKIEAIESNLTDKQKEAAKKLFDKRTFTSYWNGTTTTR